MDREPRRRLFFALWPDAELRDAIVAAAGPTVAAAGGRAVPPANLHVTLAFLGAVPATRVPDAVRAARGVSAAAGEQGFDRLATWSRGGPLVLEATRVAATLATLRESLANALIRADFALDRRSFRPHITLARAPARRLAPAPAALGWRYREFVLVESHTGPAGSRYEVVTAFPLA